MKKLFLVFSLCFSFFAQSEPVLLDQCLAVIFTSGGSVVITQSDIDRPSLDGAVKTIEDVIFELLVLQYAKDHGIEISEDSIDKYLESIQREHGLTSRQLKEMFTQAGYTYQEGREQIGAMFAVGEVMNFKIRSRLVIPEREVRAYYDAHPIIQDSRARVKRGFIPFNKKIDIEKQKDDIEKRIKAKKKIKGIEWSQPFWVQKGDIASDKQFLFEVDLNFLSGLQEVTDGFEIYKVLEQFSERLIPISDRYHEISDSLLEPRYNKLYEEFKRELLDASSIIRF